MEGSRQFKFAPSAVLEVTGEDAAEFLQSQATQDLRGGEGFCRYSLFLDHKGLIHGDGFVFHDGPESYRILSYATPAETLKAKLEKHVIAEEVEITDATDAFLVIAFAEGLPDQLPAQPPESEFGRWNVGYLYRGRRLQRGGTETLLPVGNLADISGETIPEGEAEFLRIQNGLPTIGVDLTADNNPLEGGVLSAISFDKGCYLGQEVVARLHRLQRAGKRLVRFRCSDGSISPGEEVIHDGKPVAKVTSVARDPGKGGTTGLAMVKARLDNAELGGAAGWSTVEVVEPS
jgi:folate-binding protein YgfZ